MAAAHKFFLFLANKNTEIQNYKHADLLCLFSNSKLQGKVDFIYSFLGKLIFTKHFGLGILIFLLQLKSKAININFKLKLLMRKQKYGNS